MITLDEENGKNYPKLLKEISDPPPVLYIKGNLPKQEKVIGGRDQKDY